MAPRRPQLPFWAHTPTSGRRDLELTSEKQKEQNSTAMVNLACKGYENWAWITTAGHGPKCAVTEHGTDPSRPLPTTAQSSLLRLAPIVIENKRHVIEM